MEEKIYTGFVSYYSTEKHFGFLENAEGESFYFHRAPMRDVPTAQRKEIKKTFLRGDEVNFKTRSGEKGEEAYDLQFIKNDRADRLLKLLNENELLPGYLKKINEEYYVKDKATYLFLPISISIWETDIDKVYEQRLNQLVHYLSPDNYTSVEKQKVKLSDRVMNTTCLKLKEHQEKQTTLIAKITGLHKEGYFVTLLDGEVPAFLFFKKGELIPLLNLHQQVEVLIISIYETGLRIRLAEK